jgi:hypothetical protein
MDIWRNVALAAARGLEYTFGAIARAIAGEQPVEASGKHPVRIVPLYNRLT